MAVRHLRDVAWVPALRLTCRCCERRAVIIGVARLLPSRLAEPGTTAPLVVVPTVAHRVPCGVDFLAGAVFFVAVRLFVTAVRFATTVVFFAAGFVAPGFFRAAARFRLGAGTFTATFAWDPGVGVPAENSRGSLSAQTRQNSARNA